MGPTSPRECAAWIENAFRAMAQGESVKVPPWVLADGLRTIASRAEKHWVKSLNAQRAGDIRCFAVNAIMTYPHTEFSQPLERKSVPLSLVELARVRASLATKERGNR